MDNILTKVCKRLGLEIPIYDSIEDPTKSPNDHNQEWTLQSQHVKEIEKIYNAKLKAAAAQRKADKTPFTFFPKKEPAVANKKLKRETKIDVKIELKSEKKHKKAPFSYNTEDKDAVSSP